MGSSPTKPPRAPATTSSSATPAAKSSTRRGFTSRRAAKRPLEALRGKVHRGEVRVSRATFGGYWRTWLARRRPFLQDGAWQDYRRHGKLRLLPHLADERLNTLTATWLVELAESGEWAPKTLNNALTALVVCLNQAVADGELGANPAAYVPRLPVAHIERDYLRLNEIARYLDGCAHLYRPLAETLIATGARISEALALVIADVDLNRGAILVHRSAKDHGNVGATKGRRFRRVEVGPQLCRTLETQIARRTEHVLGDAHDLVLFGMPVRRAKREKGRWASAHREPIDRCIVSCGWHKEALTDAGAARHAPA
jgi:integrase